MIWSWGFFGNTLKYNVSNEKKKHAAIKVIRINSNNENSHCSTDVLASFHYWAFGTITGLTGVILTLIVIVMYVFALPYARRNLFRAFWITHSFYIFLYIFLVMHGAGRLVQPPLFQNYFIGPAVVYLFDKMISFSRKKRELRVFTAEILPSGRQTKQRF